MTEKKQATTSSSPKFGRLFSFLAIIFFSVMVAWLVADQMNLEPQAAYMLAILVAAALLWSTETIPLFATSLMIIGSQIILLGNPGEWNFLKYSNFPSVPYGDFLSPISDPIIVLFLGGFILAKVGVKAQVDVHLSSMVLRIFGQSAKMTLIGVIGITSVFGMWISNTATTAMMITLTGSLLAFVPPGNPFRKGLTLAIPFSANIGGLMTPIGSPPNAIAVGMLAKEGVQVDFLHWMILMFPLVTILLLILYFLIWTSYKPPSPLIIKTIPKIPFSKKGKFVVLIFTVTVGMWLTDSIHGIPAAVVALFPAIMFTATGLLNAKEFNRIEWNILFVIAGGLALGQGMNITGLDMALLALLPLYSEWIVLIFFMATLILSTFISNTTTAILFIPLAISMAQIMDNIPLKFMAIGLAVMAGSSMALPISTPPNAIAYSRDELTTRDFVVNGSIIGISSLIITYGYFSILSYFNFW